MKNIQVKNIAIYEQGQIEVEVQNPFDKDADFQISIEHVYKEETPSKKKQPIKKQLNWPAFFLKTKKIWIYKGQTAKVVILYQPMTLNNHVCNLIFLDQKVGEIQYEITGFPKHPEPLQTMRFSCSVDDSGAIPLALPNKNILYSQAFQRIADKLKEMGDQKTIKELEADEKIEQFAIEV